MAIKIQVSNTVIPVEIGNVKFDYDYADKNLEEAKKKLEAVDIPTDIDDEDDVTLEQECEILRPIVDGILGEGIFDKLYAQTPSTTDVFGYTMQALDGIMDERAKKSGSEQIKKFEAMRNKRKGK